MEPMRATVAYLMMVLMVGSAGGNLPAVAAPAAPTPTAVVEVDQMVPGIHRMLWRGMKGSDVRLMQQRMIELGYMNGTADGDFGGQTEQALKRFQYYHGLVEDGMAGADTLNILFSAEAVMAPPEFGSTLPVSPPTPAPTAPARGEPAVDPTAAPTMTTPSPAPPTAQPGASLIPVVPRPEILVVMDGVVLPVVAVQDAQGQRWLFPCLTLGDILGYTASVLEGSGSYTYQLARLNPETGETLEEIGLSFSVGEDGQPSVVMLLKDDTISLLDADIQLILDENTLYVPIEFVRQALGYAAVVDGAGIQLVPLETPAP